MSKFNSSKETKEAVLRAINPADVGLKVERVTAIREKGVKIVARAAELEKIKALPSLAGEGLVVGAADRHNPRLIVYGVPTELMKEQIASDLLALNLNDFAGKTKEAKVVYIFSSRERAFTNCVLEVSPEVRSFFMGASKLYFGFAACRFKDYVRIVQCYKCLAFGHIARDCVASPRCGHCAGGHEGKDCGRREDNPVCFNCKACGSADFRHRAYDISTCPILRRRLADRAKDINYQ